MNVSMFFFLLYTRRFDGRENEEEINYIYFFRNSSIGLNQKDIFAFICQKNFKLKSTKIFLSISHENNPKNLPLRSH